MQGSKSAAAASIVAVAASIFGGVTKAQADPIIPPVGQEPPYGQVYNVQGPSATTVTLTDPNTGEPVTVPVTMSGHVTISGSETPNGPTTVLADSDISPEGTTSLMAPASMAASPDFWINTTWSGCRTVDAYADASFDWFFFTQTLYHYHQTVDWCGDGHGGVTKPAHHDSVTNVWPSVIVGERITDFADYYDAWGAYPGGPWPKSGYNTFVQRHFTGTVPGCGICDSHTYPYVNVIAFADGVAYTTAGW